MYCFDVLVYFSVPIFFNILNLIAAGLALLSALAQLRTTISARGSTTQGHQLDNVDITPESKNEEGDKMGQASPAQFHTNAETEEPPSYNTLLNLS